MVQEETAGTEETADVSDPYETVSDDSAEKAAEASVSGNISDVLKGMPEGFKLSDEEILGKQRIREHDVIRQMENMQPGVDYVEDEVIFYCEDPEYAKTVAEAYGGTLSSCELGVAVIKLDKDKISVKEAVAAGADEATLLPPVDANTKTYLTDPVKDAFVSTPEVSAEGSIFSAKKNAIDKRDWTYWKEKVGYKDPGLDPTYVYPGNPVENYAVSGYQWMHDAVGTYQAWAVTKGKGATVAVIDTGVYAGHEDLTGRVTDYSSVTDFENMKDYSGHGTHVAGIVAAAAGNNKGGVGIAPEASILAIPVFVENYYESADLAKGIDFVTNNDKPLADVINMSLGGPLYSEVEQTAITKAHDAGIAVCVSMGNDAANPLKYPAGYDNVIAVAAVDESRQKSDFSTYGEWADISAPGTAIFSTWNGSTENAPGEKQDYYASWDGTSMACPVVSGVCALYISALKEAGKEWDPDMIEADLKKSATKIPGPYKIGAGMVNAAALLSFLEDTGAPQIKVPSKLSANSVITFDAESAAGRTTGFIYTLNGKKPSAVNGEIREGFFVETVSSNVAVPVSDMLDNGLELNEDIKLTVARITGMGTMTETAEETIKLEGNAATGASIIGSDVLGKGKSLVYRLNRTLPKNSSVWELENAPDGVTINKRTGKVSSKKTSSGSFTVVADIDGTKIQKRVSLVDAAASVTLKVSGTDKNINIPVTDKNGNIKSVRLYNANTPGNTTTENKLTLTGKTDNAQIPVEYISSKPSIAEVDSNGTVTAKKAGTVKIICRAADGSNKQAAVTVKVIVPVSRIDMFLDKGMQAIAYGKSMKIRPAIGAAYGKPTINKLSWDKEPVRVTAYAGTSGIDVTSRCNQAGYVKISNGNVRVNKKISELGSSYKFYLITVRAKATDGSGITGEKTFLVIPPATKMRSLYNKTQLIRVGYTGIPDLFSGDLGLSYFTATGGRVISPEIISSNPAVVSAYIPSDGYSGSTEGIVYKCVLVANKKGTATITIKATDGSNKKATLKLRVY
ncbi:MAG: S8 family serine peptidase [Lachnospiraceae bacterium]|nr:S8 family serine peptidase [Lachnospiraceae bacterium]